VTGTTDAAEIAAVLAAVTSALSRTPEPSRYESWRRRRVAALRISVNSG
jgi:2-polyprenyl-6-methoxyphenol hydroxylase-like FAD-dependent oxidoreductase